MKTLNRIFLLAASASLFVSTARAEIPNDQNNYIGDKLEYPVRVTAVYTDAKDTENKKGEVCIPAKTTLWGMSSTSTVLYVQVRKEGVPDCNDPNYKHDGSEAHLITQKIATDRILKINRSDEPLKSMEPSRFGLTYGALIVPYKYFYSGTKDFTAQTSMGPYLGYRLSKASYGLEVKFIGFLGATTASVNQNVNGQNTTQSLAGFSYGVGVIGEIKKSFQLGFVIGVDKFSDSLAYPNSGQPWLAVSLGFEFDK